MPPKFYAVHQGVKPGVYLSWAECKRNVDVMFYSGKAMYKGFETMEEAQAFAATGFGSKIKGFTPKVADAWKDFTPPPPPLAVGETKAIDAAIAAAYADTAAFVPPPIPTGYRPEAKAAYVLPPDTEINIALPAGVSYEYQIWTDGSATFEKAAGYGFVIVKDGKVVREGGGKVVAPPFSAHQAEIQAVQAALYVFESEIVPRGTKPSFIICSDSEFVVKSINEWGPRRNAAAWVGKSYASELQMFIGYLNAWQKVSPCAIKHVSRDAGLEHNVSADKIAKTYKDQA